MRSTSPHTANNPKTRKTVLEPDVAHDAPFTLLTRSGPAREADKYLEDTQLKATGCRLSAAMALKRLSSSS